MKGLWQNIFLSTSSEGSEVWYINHLKDHEKRFKCRPHCEYQSHVKGEVTKHTSTPCELIYEEGGGKSPVMTNVPLQDPLQ